MSDHLSVKLHDELVGYISLLANDRLIFSFASEYIENENRPTLSLSFYDEYHQLLVAQRPTQTKASPFFSNLLPEGHMREYLASRDGVNINRDYPLLKLLGADLPGAVVIQEADLEQELTASSELHSDSENNSDILRFSLAGIQLKFSALMETQGGLTIPAYGVGGDWIVKLPSVRFKNVPENEFTMMSLAKQIGLNVPEVTLLPFETIQGLKDFSEFHGQQVLAVKRFDRHNGQRVHIEDFAQAFGVYPANKYGKVSYNNIAALLSVAINQEAVFEFLDRLVFNVIIGNADFHLKNLSLIYSDTVNPELAPAYDLVSTEMYLPDNTMALSLFGEKKIDKLEKLAWIKLAKLLHISEKKLFERIEGLRERILTVWQVMNKDALTDEAIHSIDQAINSRVELFKFR